MKRTLKIFTLIFGIVLVFSASVYGATIYDMQKVNLNVEKPTAEFFINYETQDGRSGEVKSNSKYYDSDVYSFDQNPNSVKVPIGTKIEFVDSSTPGSGTRIKAYDFQVYAPSESKLYYLNSLDDAPSMKLDEEGRYEFYLCVMDNYQRVNGYDNWSVNGNHRWLTKRQDNAQDKFWWYFTQVNVIVYGTDEEETPIEEEPVEEEEEEIEEPEKINHPPELHVIKPSSFYPVELTSIGLKTNTIKWTYYDEDGDEFDHGAYELYKKTNNTKTLIERDDYISNEDELFVNIEGEMGEKFSIMMYVYDSEGNKASKGTDFEILSFNPRIQIINKDRTYISDDLNIEIRRVDDGFEKYFDINYLSWEVIDENNNVVESGNGILPSKLVLMNKYKEDCSYLIKQNIKNTNNDSKTFESRFYIVPIMPPLVSLDMISGYIGEIKDTGLIISQKQSPLRGNLPEYIYNFTNKDGYYEIYYGSSLKFRSDGLCFSIDLDDRFEQGKTYKLIQYVSNGVGKEGFGTTNIQIKEAEENKLTLQIVERDNNPLTLSDEIYPKEKILLKANLRSANKILKKESWIENEMNEKIYEEKGLFNELVQINEIGKYKACSKVWLDNGEELVAEVLFVVKPIQPPIISYELIKNEYFRNEIFNPNIKIKDINMSEEHPNGYGVFSNYIWREKQNDGIFKNEKLAGYKNKEWYTLIQNAINEEFSNIQSDEEIKIYLKNKKPILDVQDYFECSAGELISFSANAFDEDGTIEKIETELTYETENINKHTKKMNVSFCASETGVYKYSIKCIDDSGDEDLKNITIKVSDNKEYPYIKILDYEENRLKENRYIQIEFGNVFDLENHFKIDDKLITSEVNSDDYHLVFESENIVGLYFKKPGTFIASNYIEVNSKQIKRNLILDIVKDESPKILLKTDNEIYRKPETNEAEAAINYQWESDDQIDRIEIYVDDVKLDSYCDGDFINVKFGGNILGRKKIYARIYETHKYLPQKEHKLFEELVYLMKSDKSENVWVNILNMKPVVTFNVNNNSKIRIIE